MLIILPNLNRLFCQNLSFLVDRVGLGKAVVANLRLFFRYLLKRDLTNLVYVTAVIDLKSFISSRTIPIKIT